MTSQSSSSKSNKSDDEINVEKEDTGSGSSNKQRFSHVYQYFTWNELTSCWDCLYCE